MVASCVMRSVNDHHCKWKSISLSELGLSVYDDLLRDVRDIFTPSTLSKARQKGLYYNFGKQKMQTHI